ncbi:hypothetical protein [Dactylosporangium sp. CA-233914]
MAHNAPAPQNGEHASAFAVAPYRVTNAAFVAATGYLTGNLGFRYAGPA